MKPQGLRDLLKLKEKIDKEVRRWRLVVFLAFTVWLGLWGWSWARKQVMQFRGRRLAIRVMSLFNDNRRGRLSISSIDWKWQDLPLLLEGRALPVTIRGLVLFDVRDRPVLSASRVDTTVYLGPLLHNGSVVFGRFHAPSMDIAVERFPAPEDPSRNIIGIADLFAEAYPTPMPEVLPVEPWVFVMHDLEVDRLRIRTDISGTRSLLEGSLSGVLDIRGLTRDHPMRIGYDITARFTGGHVTAQGHDIPVDTMEVRASHPASETARAVITASGSLAGTSLAVGLQIGGTGGMTWRARLSSLKSLLSLFSPVPVLEQPGGSELLARGTMDASDMTATLMLRGLGASTEQGPVHVHESLVRYRSVGNESLVTVDRLDLMTPYGPVESLGNLDPSSLSWEVHAFASVPHGLAVPPYLKSGHAAVTLSGTGFEGPFSVKVAGAAGGQPYSAARLTASLKYSASTRELTVGRLRLSIPGGMVAVRGRVDTALSGRLGVHGVMEHADRYLRFFGVPLSAGGVRVSSSVSLDKGRYFVSGSYSLGSIGYAGVSGSLSGRFSVQPGTGTVTVDSGGALGASISGRASWTGRKLDAALKFSGLSLSGLVPWIAGTLGGSVKVSGPVHNPTLSGSVRSSRLDIGSVTFTDVRADISGTASRPDVRARCTVAGGHLTVRSTRNHGILGIHTSLSRLSLAFLTGSVAAGFLSWDLSVSSGGINGVVNADGLSFMGMPWGRAILRMKGRDGQGSFDGGIDKLLMISGGYDLKSRDVTVSASLEPIRLSRMVPARFLDPYGVDGTIAASVRASWAQGALAYSGAVDTLSLEFRDTAHLMKPYVISLKAPMRFSGDASSVRLEPTLLTGGMTRLMIWGEMGPSGGLVRLRGDVDLAPLRYHVPAEVAEDMFGMVSVDLQGEVSPSGSAALYGKMYFAGNTVVTPYGTFVLRAGEVAFSGRRATLKDVRIEAWGEFLTLSGFVELDDSMRPASAQLSVRGVLPASMLTSLLPQMVFASRGGLDFTASIKLENGRLTWSGRIATTETVSVSLRSGMELRLPKGALVEFSSDGVKIHNLVAGVDDGAVSLEGTLSLDGTRVRDVDLQIDLTGLPYHVPETLDGEISGHLALTGSEGSMSLGGRLEVRKARYYRKFRIDLMGSLFEGERVDESSGSIVQEYPQLGAIGLDVSLALHGDVEIYNNLMETNLDGTIHMRGTVAQPKFGGSVRLQGGWFRIPMLRGTYELEEGLIDLDRAGMESRPKWEPYFLVRGQMPYVDRNDEEISVYLNVQGYLSELKLDWSSSTNLTSSQVLTLLMSGRTPDEIRQGSRGIIPDLGGVFEGYIPLNVQLGITSDAIQVAIRHKYWNNHVEVSGKVEMGFMGRQEQEARVQVRVHDRVAVAAKARRRTYEEQVPVEGEDGLTGRIEVRYSVNFKGTIWDMLGF